MTNAKIIIDTNAWMAVGQFHVPIFQEFDRIFGTNTDLIVLSGSIDELEKIKESSRGKDKLAANLALKIIAQKVSSKEIIIQTTKEGAYVDDLLVEESKKSGLVLTADRELQKRLTKPYLIIKQKKYLELIE